MSVEATSNTNAPALVRSSVLLVPASLAACRSVADGAPGACVSIVVESVSVPTLPAASVKVTATG